MNLIYELITFPLSIFDNPIYDMIIMGIIGSISFALAWRITGDLDVGGGLGSIVHWTIRLITTLAICSAISLVIIAIKFIMKYWIFITISACLILIILILKKYSQKNSNSILNKVLL